MTACKMYVCEQHNIECNETLHYGMFVERKMIRVQLW